MAFYITRSSIKKLPAVVIRDVPKPQPTIIEGFGSREKVGSICRDAGYKQVILVTDKTLLGLQLHRKVVDSLNECGIGVSVFSDIEGEPTLQVVEAGRKAALLCNAQCIIALGGGSVLDSSKMIAGWAKRPSQKVGCPKFMVLKNKTLPLITIPSTAGTGAEVTVGAIVKKSSEGTKNSTVIFGLDITNVILDGELTLKAPLGVTASCGIDALSHGLEGAVGDVRVSIQDKIKSFECVKLCLENLNRLIDDLSDADARQAMCKAAFYGGNAINKQLAGYVHAFAHSLGAKYHIPHGIAIALCLYPVMNYQKKYCTYQLAELAYYCNLASIEDSDDVAAEMLLEAVKKLIDKSGLLKSAVKIPRKDYLALSEMIFMDSINYSVPVVFKKADIYHLLDEINKLRG